MIAVEPDVDPETGEVGDAAEARRAGRGAAGPRRGSSGARRWEDVARTGRRDRARAAGRRPRLAPEGQRLRREVHGRRLRRRGEQARPPWSRATTGRYRIGRYTESAPAEVDGTFQQQIEAAGIKLGRLPRGGARRRRPQEALGQGRRRPVSSRASSATSSRSTCPSRTGSAAGAEPGVKVRWIVFSPNDTTDGCEGPARRRSGVDQGQGRRGRRLRRAQAPPGEVRRDGPHALRRGLGQDDRRQAALDTTRPPTIDEPVKTAVLADGPDARPAPGAGEGRRSAGTSSSSCGPTGDGDDAWLTALKAKITDRRARSSSARRTTARARRPRTAATSAGSRRASSRRARQGDLRARRSASTSDVVTIAERRAATCSGSSPRRPGPRPTSSSRSSRTAASPTGTRSRRKPRRSTYNTGSSTATG